MRSSLGLLHSRSAHTPIVLSIAHHFPTSIITCPSRLHLHIRLHDFFSRQKTRHHPGSYIHIPHVQFMAVLHLGDLFSVTLSTMRPYPTKIEHHFSRFSPVNPVLEIRQCVLNHSVTLSTMRPYPTKIEHHFGRFSPVNPVLECMLNQFERSRETWHCRLRPSTSTNLLPLMMCSWSTRSWGLAARSAH